ncbi:MAG: hypothetical protein JSV88_18875 [Candidatus Aminicenantes bacterium]|nr:MAG: hypothetical protein JSV88_18875 [Candidatus Aminicenantes bacterium]
MMKKVIFIVMLLLLVLFGFPREPMKKEFPVKPGQKLDIDLKTAGSIDISGWEKNQMAVTVYFKNGDGKYWDITFDETKEGIYIESRYTGSNYKRAGSTNFEINVPHRFDLKLKTMGGSITIDHVQGEITGKTMGGNLKLSHLKGNLNLKTMGGKIELTDSDIDGKVKTMGGRVLLENVVGDVSGSSMGGNVIYKNVKSRSGKSTGKVVHISTMGGAINVSDASHGADVHTMGGNIHIKSAKEFVKAKTMGGNIDIDSIDGWVSATTMGGDINVTMTGDPGKGKRDVTLTTMGGDITLTVPPGLSMDIDLEIEITERSDKEYKIISDFKIQQEKTGQWDKSKGSPRKHIYGKAKMKEGKHKIKIKTVNGNIVLKRS